jgi:peptidoglycan L-alanyl-D-glutamate endopeptidase CwlK
MPSRKLEDLHPDVRPLAEAFLRAAEDEGIDVLVICTWRSGIEQAALYALGRTAKGKIVTNARPGESLHNVMLNGMPASRALDVVPTIYGKPIWDASNPLWDRLGAIGRSVGLSWAGDWKGKLLEKGHFEKKEMA